jgi:hypothetical protein
MAEIEFKTTPDGNVEIWKGGQRVSTVAAGAVNNELLQSAVIPTPKYTPPQSADGIKTSSQAQINNQTAAAGAAATKSLTSDTTFGLSAQGYFDYLKSRGEQATATGEQRLGAIQLQYDAQKAQQNFTYSQAIQELEGKRVNAVEAATSRAISLNPYSQAKQASTSANFTGKLNQIYQAEESKLRQQADLAEQAILANNTAALIEAQSNIDQTLAGLDQKAFELIMSLEKEQRAESRFQQQEERLSTQFEKGFALDVEQTEISRLNTAQDNLRQLIQMSGVPDSLTSKEVDDWTINDISPYLDFALASGFDFDTAMKVLPSMLQGATLAQQRQELAIAKEERIAANQIAAQDRATNAQLSIAARQEAYAQAEGSGAQRDSVDYAVAAARGTQNSPYQITNELLTKYKSSEELINRLDSFKESIDELAAIEDKAVAGRLINIFNEWTNNPLSDTSQTFVARQIPTTYRLLRAVYGEGSRISDKDLQFARLSLGTGVQSSVVRARLFEDHLKALKESAISNLKFDALAGYPVFGMADSVNDLIDKIDEKLAEPVVDKGGGGFDYNAWKRKKGLE